MIFKNIKIITTIAIITIIELTSSFMTIPNIYNNWFCLDFVKNIDKTKPQKYSIGDLPLVVWFKNESLPLSTINICSHHGSTLDSGKINKNGCLVCPYHGLNHDEKLTFGKTMIHQGKLWWSYDNHKKPPSIPFYNNKNFMKSELVIDMNANVFDCIYNTMDINHAEFIHNNMFGFGNSNNPISNLKIYNYKNNKKLGLSFNYKSNTNLKHIKNELKIPNRNFNIYEYPYDIWNGINLNKKEKFYTCFSFLPLSNDKTRWFITLSHNFWKSDIEKKIMEIAGQLILLQDKNQMKNQAKKSKLKSIWINQIKFNNEQQLDEIRNIIKYNNNNTLDLMPTLNLI